MCVFVYIYCKSLCNDNSKTIRNERIRENPKEREREREREYRLLFMSPLYEVSKLRLILNGEGSILYSHTYPTIILYSRSKLRPALMMGLASELILEPFLHHDNTRMPLIVHSQTRGE
jgi:hypothetical protein